MDSSVTLVRAIEELAEKETLEVSTLGREADPLFTQQDLSSSHLRALVSILDSRMDNVDPSTPQLCPGSSC